MDIVHLRDVKKKLVETRTIQWLIADEGAFQSDLCTCNVVELAPGSCAKPPHSHSEEEEAVYVLEGKGEMCSAEGKSYPVEAGTFLLLRKNEIHMLSNNSDAPLKVICFFPSKTHVSKYTFHPMQSVGLAE